VSERESPAKGPTTPFLLSTSVSTSVQVVSVAQVFLQPQRAAVFAIPPRGCFVFDFLLRGLPESRLGAMCPRSILHSPQPCWVLTEHIAWLFVMSAIFPLFFACVNSLSIRKKCVSASVSAIISIVLLLFACGLFVDRYSSMTAAT